MFDDLLFAARSLRKSPGFTLVAVLALGLGIGASTAMFSVVNSVMLRPLPYPEPRQLVRIWEDSSAWGFPENTPAPANYTDWKAQANSFSHMAAFRRWPYTLTGNGEPVRLDGMKCAADMFPLLGVQPLLGRVFNEQEDNAGAPAVVVLGYGLWRDRFGGDPAIVGKSISLDGAPHTVVGVMPPGFQVPGWETEFFTPLAWDSKERARRGAHFLQVIGRLKPGVSLEQARTEMRGIAKRLEQQYPDSNTNTGAVVNSLRHQLSGKSQPMLLALLGMVGFLMLIGCSNVAGLMVARAAGKQRELAVRSALGASQGKILRLELAESTLLAVLAGVAGVTIAAWTRTGVQALLPQDMHGAKDVQLDPLVLAFSVLLATLTALLSGIAPALLAMRSAVADTLRQGGRNQVGGRTRLRQVLVGAEVALSVMLLTGAGLFLHSFLKLQQQELGYDPSGLVTMRVILPDTLYPKDEQQTAFYVRALERIRALPGVEDAGWTYRLPTTMAGGASMVTIDGRPAPPRGQESIVPHRYVSASYFNTMRMKLKQGRWMEARDTQGPVFGVVVNQSFVDRFFPNEPALDRTFVNSNESARCRIVGVVANVREYNINEPAQSLVYIPLEANPMIRDLVIRTPLAPDAMAAAVRREIQSMDPGLAVSHVKSMDDILATAVAGPRVTMLIAGVFAVLALLLTGIGLAGVVAQGVVERTREIGLRVALGARQGNVLSLVLKQGGAPALCGLIAGLAASAALSAVVRTLLYEVQPHDTITYFGAVLLLAIVAALAMLLPALRALRIEPMTALRCD